MQLIFIFRQSPDNLTEKEEKKKEDAPDLDNARLALLEKTVESVTAEATGPNSIRVQWAEAASPLGGQR